MTLTDHVLSRSALTVEGDRSWLDIGLPWYRSLPLSAITDLRLQIGDESFESGDLYLEVDGVPVPTDLLAGYTSQYWFLQDRLPLVVRDWLPAPSTVTVP